MTTEHPASARQHYIMQARKYAGKWLAETRPDGATEGPEPINAHLAAVLSTCVRPPREDELGAIRWALAHIFDDDAEVPASTPPEYEKEPLRVAKITMNTVADFRRVAVAGSRWLCMNLLHPHVSGLRIVTGGKSALRYEGTKADGTRFAHGRMEVPKASAVRFYGASVRFLYDATDDRIAYTWTLLAPDAAMDVEAMAHE